MSSTPDELLYKELYARFGLAYYESECLHLQLCLALAISGIRHRYQTTRPRVEELLAHALTLTLGSVISELEGKVPAEIARQFGAVLDARNFLAHRFWLERTEEVKTAEGVLSLLSELDGYAQLFEAVDEKTTAWFSRRMGEIGGVDSKLQQSFDEVIATTRLNPLPTRAEIQDYEKKLKGRIRVVKAWTTKGTKRNALVFEERDGNLWQLCEVGLGWSIFREVGKDWREEPTIQGYLPKDVSPRPQVAGMWNYQIDLGKDAAIVIRPGSQPGTFLMEVRKGSNA